MVQVLTVSIVNIPVHSKRHAPVTSTWHKLAGKRMRVRIQNEFVSSLGAGACTITAAEVTVTSKQRTGHCIAIVQQATIIVIKLCSVKKQHFSPAFVRSYD